VRAYAHRFEAVCGNLGTRQIKYHGSIGSPVPESLTVEWRTPDGRPHSRIVAFRQQVPADIDGATIYLILGKDEAITVQAFTRDERQANKEIEFLDREGLR
jgi:hypothetical protein